VTPTPPRIVDRELDPAAHGLDPNDRHVRAARQDVRANLRDAGDGPFFAAGASFGSRIYTRDIALSGLLSLNRLMPEVMARSIRVTREARRRADLMIDTGRPMPRLPLPWTDSGLDRKRFMATYQTNAYDRRTDDVIWLWAAGDLLRQAPDAGLTWHWVHDTGRMCFERFYDPLFDRADGLYRGQAVFFDIPFPDRHVSGYPWDWSADAVLNARALSTNAAYVMGLRVMHEAARHAGGDDASHWAQRTDRLAQRIREAFDLGDGTLSYLRGEGGELQPHRDALGTALCILAGVVTGEQARRMVERYPVASYGVPLLHPPRPDNDWPYHNRSAWPFVDAFFYWAADLARGRNTADDAARRLAASGYDGRSFREFVRADTGEPAGSSSQLWSAAGYLNAALRRGAAPLGQPDCP